MFIPQDLSRTIELVASHAGIDFLIFQMELGMSFLQGPGRVIVETGREVIIETARRIHKPLVVVLSYGGSPQGISLLAETQERYVEAGLPIFPSIERAALAVSRFISYHEARNSG
jgi:hypothetical protein